MDKYNHLKVLVKRKARAVHQCNLCDKEIIQGEFYYSEELSDKHINYPLRKKICQNCYNKIYAWNSARENS